MNINYWKRLKEKRKVIYTSFGEHEWRPKTIGYFN